MGDALEPSYPHDCSFEANEARLSRAGVTLKRDLPMTNPVLAEAQLQPLDQIRMAEAEVKRKLAAVREEHEHTLAGAQVQAEALLAEARDDGRREGKNQYQEIIARAEEEARAITAEAKSRAQELKRIGSRHMDTAVQQIIAIITGIEDTGQDQ